MEKETIEVKQLHDNDKYIITRILKEEVDGAKLLDIYKELDAAITEVRKQLYEIPKQVEVKTESLNSQLSVLEPRLAAFEKYADKLKESDIKEPATAQ